MTGSRGRRSRLFIALCVLNGFLIVGVGGAGIWIVSHAGSTAFESDDAFGSLDSGAIIPERLDLRDDVTATTDVARQPPPEEEAATPASGGTPQEVVSSTSVPGTTLASPDASAPPAPGSTENVEAFRRPSEGVFHTESAGYSEVPGTALRHEYPDETFPVIRHLDGCEWRLEHTVYREVVDALEFCSDADGVSLLRWRFERSFVGIHSVVDLVCSDPPALLAPGTTESRDFHCVDEAREIQVSGTVPPATMETVELPGGESVPAARLDIDAVLTGEFEGTVEMSVWLQPETGMWLAENRIIDGGSRFQERSEFLYHATTPTRSS